MSEAVTSPLTLEERIRQMLGELQAYKGDVQIAEGTLRAISDERARRIGMARTLDTRRSGCHQLADQTKDADHRAWAELWALIAKLHENSASPTPSVDYSGVRARIAQLAHAGPLNCSAGAFAALGIIDEEEAKANAKVEAALALLKEPRVGTVVALKTGETWTFGGRNWTYSSEGLRGYPVTDEAMRETLCALVSSGAAYVTEGRDA